MLTVERAINHFEHAHITFREESGITEGHQSVHVNMEKIDSVTLDETSHTDQSSLTRIDNIHKRKEIRRNKRSNNDISRS